MEDNKKKSYEELMKERENLLAEIDNLKKSNDSQSVNIEMNSLKEENDNLRKLVEEYKNDLTNANKFAQQIMLEYGSRKQEQDSILESAKQLDAEAESYREAEDALNEYLKLKGDN